MQLKFVSLGLVAVVLMTAVNADTVGVKGTNVDVSNVLTHIANGANVQDNANGIFADVARRKRSLAASKKIATAIRRRAIARRSEEADEEEADEEEADDEEADDEEDFTAQEGTEESTEETEEDVEAAATEEDETAVADDKEESTEEDTDESTEDESQWERRDLPVIGGLLGSDKSTGGSTGGLLGL